MMQITLQVYCGNLSDVFFFFFFFFCFFFFALTLRTLDRNFSHSLQWANHILS